MLSYATGIIDVFYYSTDLFIGAGLQRDSAKYATIGLLLNDFLFLTEFYSITRLSIY